MDFNKEAIRGIICYNCQRGLTRKQCREEMVSLIGEQAPSLASIKKWYNNCLHGRTSVSDVSRSGRPGTAVTEENIAAVRKIIEKDSEASYNFIRASLGIGISQIQKILYCHLGVKKRKPATRKKSSMISKPNRN